jgi:hypothetical protein
MQASVECELLLCVLLDYPAALGLDPASVHESSEESENC